MSVTFTAAGMPTFLDPARRGYHAVYRKRVTNHCPGCGRSHWLIGRISAECAFCATALPLAEVSLPARYAPVFTCRFGRDLEAFAA